MSADTFVFTYTNFLGTHECRSQKMRFEEKAMVTSMYLVLFVVGRPVWQFNNKAIHSIRDLPWTHMQHAILQREPLKFSIIFTRSYSIFSVEFSSLQLIFSGCVATVKCRAVLWHCVILFWSLAIMDCICLFENGVPLIR